MEKKCGRCQVVKDVSRFDTPFPDKFAAMTAAIRASKDNPQPSVTEIPVRLWCSKSVVGMHASVGVFARRDDNSDSVEITTPGGFFIKVPQ